MITQLLRMSATVFMLLAACQTDSDSGRSAPGADEGATRESSQTLRVCSENLPKARTVVLQGAGCDQRPLRRCAHGLAGASLDAELRTMLETCGAFPNQVFVGATFEGGCAEEIRLSAEVPSNALRCLADELDGTRLDCAEDVPCAVVELSTLAAK